MRRRNVETVNRRRLPYYERYGLIYTGFRSQKRTIKDSGLWYAKVAASNHLNV